MNAKVGLEYSTYIGGSGDWANSVALDSSSMAYVTGYGTAELPITAGSFQTHFGGGTYDAFVTKLNMTTPGPPATITVEGGGTQSTTVSTAFGSALQVKVTDASNNPLPGVTVTFSAPTGPRFGAGQRSMDRTTGSGGRSLTSCREATSAPADGSSCTFADVAQPAERDTSNVEATSSNLGVPTISWGFRS